jgi:hypothetical protein
MNINIILNILASKINESKKNIVLSFQLKGSQF